MSVMFYVSNKKKLFFYEKPLTIKQILELDKDLQQFTYFDNYDENTSIEKVDILSLGNDLCGRGFEIAFDKKNQKYMIRITTPATTYDWKLMLVFIEKLAITMHSNIQHENGTVYKPNTIHDFNYMFDIEYGINHLNSIEMPEIIFDGLKRPVFLKKDTIQQIVNSQNMIKEFEKIMNKTQNLQSFSANCAYFKNNQDEIFGIYTITMHTAISLPYKPFVEIKNMDITQNSQVSYYNIALVVFEDENDYDTYQVYKTLKYEKFIEQLQEHQYSWIDDGYIELKPLSKLEFDKFVA